MELDAYSVLDRNALARICQMSETKFGGAFGMKRTEVHEQRAPDNFYFHKDNGSSILAVAHLDTVGLAHERACRYVDTEAGPVVYSRALDDRLGAYIILDMLPKLGIDVDVLLTVGEETGQSTAAYFDAPKQYDWMIEFDRGGTDVVTYQYGDRDTDQLVRDAGAYVGNGIFSDISYLEHLGVKGFNWGVGYEDYHSARAHAFLNDTCDMVNLFLTFHEQNYGRYLHHEEQETPSSKYLTRSLGQAYRNEWEWDDDDLAKSNKLDEDDIPGWYREELEAQHKAVVEDISDPFHWNDYHFRNVG